MLIKTKQPICKALKTDGAGNNPILANDGAGITVDEAAGAAVDAIYRPDEDVVWGEGESKQEAEQIALSLHAKYCTTIAPAQDYAAVEVLCERLEIADLGIALTGTTDRVRRVDDGYGIADLKTGKAAVGADGMVKTSGHAYQIGVYELLAEFGAGLPITAPAEIIGLNTAKTEKAQRVGIGTVAGARNVLLGDGEQPGVLEIAARMIKSGVFFGNPRSMMCHRSYCPVWAVWSWAAGSPFLISWSARRRNQRSAASPRMRRQKSATSWGSLPRGTRTLHWRRWK